MPRRPAARRSCCSRDTRSPGLGLEQLKAELVAVHREHVPMVRAGIDGVESTVGSLVAGVS